ncbi:MFS transporter [Dongshaea marina]|uniref:MFS transporter n=1 Tax=Dongshaea marina TaxID=2047966 RepID=UPI000D3E8EF1|nr:MFS transporter [Dongshaea marina]
MINQQQHGTQQRSAPAGRRELFSWAMFDFANSGYTTVVMTAIFNAYFVGVIAASTQGAATFLWTIAVGLSNLIVLISAPALGAIADQLAIKKRLLLATALGCILFTALLFFTGPGDVLLAMTLVILANVMFASGENLIAAFLPEICDKKMMGKVSGYGWGLGYFGGLLTLGICLGYIAWAEQHGLTAEQFVPGCMLIVALLFALSVIPTFLWLRERAQPSPGHIGVSLFMESLGRLRQTLHEAAHFKDLFRFLITLVIYQCGISTVIVLAAIYAQEVVGLNSQEIIILIMVVNVTAAIGAFFFGFIQDRLGSVRTLSITLLLWCLAVLIIYLSKQAIAVWVAGNLIGLAMGASQSAGRALIGLFTPVSRTAEFFGLWGASARLAAIIGPLSYGFINYMTDGDHQLSILSTLLFFMLGLVLLFTINEKRGMEAAKSAETK